MKRIIIVIEGGMLRDVYTDADTKDIDVELIDYDNIEAICDEEEREEAEAEAESIEAEVKAGTLKSCW